MSSNNVAKRNPIVLWAQRHKYIYLTIEVEDMKIEELKCDENKFVLKGTRKDDRYDVELELYGNVKWDEHTKANSSRHVELVIPKAKEEWWPRLLKASGKVAWIKVNFDKWVDEDDAIEENALSMDVNPFMEHMDFSSMMGSHANDPLLANEEENASSDEEPEATSDQVPSTSGEDNTEH
ncbi:hypothetical protein M3Y98_00579100 [Aphelenchoides besseyi]|nr:hypothetical protein M3Y98_00579100 [Aphelenchoides besseyi]KAI6193866.1 hypothetical protein M3Y96_01064200 [Aphelenchoides besseyi]